MALLNPFYDAFTDRYMTDDFRRLQNSQNQQEAMARLMGAYNQQQSVAPTPIPNPEPNPVLLLLE